MKRLPQVATEMALHVLAYNLTRVMKHPRRGAAHRGDPDVRGAHRRHQIAHGGPGKPRRFQLALRPHAKLSLASPGLPRPKRFHTTKTHCRRAAQSLVAKYQDRKLKVAFLQHLVVSVHMLKLWRSWWGRK